MSGERYVIPVELGLGRFEAALALLLATRERVSAHAAFDLLYADRTEKPKFRTIRVHVCKLRKKLKRLGLKVETDWGFGWRMPAADRERFRAMISAKPT